MRFAQLLYGRLHWIFEADEVPNWPPDQDGNPIELVNITNVEAREGDGYNPKTKKVVPMPALDNPEGHISQVTWNKESYEFDIEHIPILIEEPVNQEPSDSDILMVAVKQLADALNVTLDLPEVAMQRMNAVENSVDTRSKKAI